MTSTSAGGTARGTTAAAFIALTTLAGPGPAGGHPVPLDSRGCHWAGSPPTYHCHTIRDTPRAPGRPAPRREGERRPPERSEETETGHVVKVVRVSDGDTVHVKIGKVTEKVRYIGISAPELEHAVWAGADVTQAARAVNARLVLGKRVVLEYDKQRRDGFGRLLAYVWVEDLLVNAELVRLGYAHVVETENDRHQALLQRAEQEARQERRGLWGRASPEGDVARQPAAPVRGRTPAPAEAPTPSTPSAD